MRKLVAEVFDPATRYEYELPLPSDIARALELDARFEGLALGLIDGTVAAVAKRRQVYRVLTTDRRDMGDPCRTAPRVPLICCRDSSCAGSARIRSTISLEGSTGSDRRLWVAASPGASAPSVIYKLQLWP